MQGARGRLVLLVAALALLLPSTAGAASDPYRPSQWGIARIAAERAWGVSDGAGVVVAVVDSGVDLAHPDLRGNLLRDRRGRVVGRDFVDGGDPQDGHGHGTMVAGVVAAVTGNGEGVVGTAPKAKIMPVRVLDERGQGTSEDVEAAIRWAVDHGADVVNLSLESDGGGESGGGLGLPLLRGEAPADAVDYAWSKGVVVVAASGNSSEGFTDYPSGSPVLVVGASDRRDRVVAFSDTGRRDAVVAPGVGIVSTWCREGTVVCDGSTHTYGQADGTSFAAPFASGAVALLRAAGHGPAEALRRLRETAHDIGAPGPDAESGYGRIDVAAAVGATAATQSAPPDPAPRTTPSTRETAEPAPRPSPRTARQRSSRARPSPRPAPSPTAEPTPTPKPMESPEPPPPLAAAPPPPPAGEDPAARAVLVTGFLLLIGGTSWDLLVRRRLG